MFTIHSIRYIMTSVVIHHDLWYYLYNTVINFGGIQIYSNESLSLYFSALVYPV